MLGYQLRVPVEAIPCLWTEERRSQYLIVREIKAPLSADKLVWPCVDSPEISLAIFDDYTGGLYEAPNGLSVFQLKSELTVEALSKFESCQVVSFAVGKDVNDQLRTDKYVLQPKKVNKPVESKMKTVGLDVCDEQFISGLMNCMLPDEAQIYVRDKYKRFINNCGLFDRYETALSFARDVSKLVPEHAPFFPVYIFKFDPLA